MKLLDYILGSRSGEKANRIERKAMRDPFLYEVLDGYDRVPHDTDKALRELRKEIRMRTSNRRKHLFVWSSVASLLVLVLGGVYFLFVTNLPEDEDFLGQGNAPVSTSEITETQEQKEDSSIIPIPEENIGKKKLQSEVATPPVPVASEKKEEILAEKIAVTKSVVGKVEKRVVSPNIIKAGTGKVSGIVTDESGEPLIGASIYATSDYRRGTVTNINGYFEFKAEPGEELEISYIGFKNQSVPATEGLMEIILQTNNDLEEVVITGSGAQRRVTITGAVTTVDVKELKNPSRDISNALAGSVAGIQSNTKAPKDRTIKSAKKPKPDVGYKSLKKYIKENKKYTGKGKVTLSFSINMAGRPVDIQVEKDSNPEAAEDAIRLIKEGPNWTLSDKRIKYVVRF